MAKNHRGTGERVHVTAAAARTSGVLTRESQFTGVPITNALNGARYALAITGEWEIPFVSGALKGDDVWISQDGLNTVSRTAHNAAAPATTDYVGRVTGVPGDAASKAVGDAAPPAGKMIVALDPGRN